MLVCESVDFTNTLVNFPTGSIVQRHNGKNCLMLEAGDVVPLYNHDGLGRVSVVVIGTTQRVSWG